MPLIKFNAAGTPRDIKTVGDLRNCAREDAAELLESYWEGELPVDPVVIARQMGVSVFEAELGEDTYGMIIGTGASADIYVDRDQPKNRFRFTSAHELGHYVDHVQNLDESDPKVGYIDKRSDDGRGHPDEIYANEFAASLLMPENLLKQLARESHSIFEIADRFRVSPSAMSWRLKHLGIPLGK